MFLWWSKDWEANSPRKGEPHTRAPPGGTTPGSTRSHHLTPTSSSVRRTQIAPRGSAGPGVVFGNDARPRGAGDLAREDAALAGKGSLTAATTTPMVTTRSSDALVPASGGIFGWTPAFFSWLLPGADEESATQLEIEKRKVAELEAALELARSVQNKPSNVITGTYSKWQVVEHNRQIGADGRETLVRNQQRRDEFRQRHAASGLEKVKEAQTRKGAVAEAIRKARDERLELGHQTNREKREWHDRREAIMADFRVGSARMHALRVKAGDEQKERMVQSKPEMLQERRQTVMRLKQEAHERALSEQQQVAQQLDTCRDRVDKVRAATAPQVAAASARHFYNARLQTADVVRRSLTSWTAERKERKGAFSERARQNREAAYASRKGGWEGQQALHGKKAEDAKRIRASLAHVETRDKHLKLEEQAQKRVSHDAQYATRFVDGELAGDYEQSPYVDAVNAHRKDGVHVPTQIKPRGNWQAYFGGQVGGRIGGSGFFSERIYV